MKSTRTRTWYLLFAALLLLGVLANVLIGLGILRSPAETRWIGVALVPVIGLVVRILGQEFRRWAERREPLIIPPLPSPTVTKAVPAQRAARRSGKKDSTRARRTQSRNPPPPNRDKPDERKAV